MSKLISRPSLCGARSKPICTINGSLFLPCPKDFEFPTKCPLQDGIKRYETFKEVLAVTKKICIEETGMSLLEALQKHKLTPAIDEIESKRIQELIKPKKQYRRRSNCTYHIPSNDMFGRCSVYAGKNDSNLCQGVNCGHFKQKR